jgi:hypothetical protein
LLVGVIPRVVGHNPSVLLSTAAETKSGVLLIETFKTTK